MNEIEELTVSRMTIIESSKICNPYMVVLSAAHDANIAIEFNDYMETCMVEFLNRHKEIRSAIKDQNAEIITSNMWQYLNIARINKAHKLLSEIKNTINKYFDDEKLDKNSVKDFDSINVVFARYFNDNVMQNQTPIYHLAQHVTLLLTKLLRVFINVENKENDEHIEKQYHKFDEQDIFITSYGYRNIVIHFDRSFSKLWEKHISEYLSKLDNTSLIIYP